MRRNSIRLFVVLLLISIAALAQVVAPIEIKDPALRDLQQKYMDDLKVVGQEIVTSNFAYPFYLSRKLDIDEQQQKVAAQRSIRFDHFNGKTVLAITGNYYAAYSADKLNGEQRARETFLNVVMPILRATTFSEQQECPGLCAGSFAPHSRQGHERFHGASGKPCRVLTPARRAQTAFSERRRRPAGCAARGPSPAQRRTCHYLAQWPRSTIGIERSAGGSVHRSRGIAHSYRN